MLIHLEIFFCIFTLMLGTWVVYDAFRLSRTTPHRFLKPIAVFILFYNLSILLRLVTQYTCANILASCFICNASIYSKALAPFAFLINLGMTLSVGAVVLSFLGKKPAAAAKFSTAAVVLLMALAYTARTVLSERLNLLPWLPLFNQSLYLAVVLLACVFLVLLLIGARGIRDPGRALVIRTFAIFYLIAYAALISSFLFYPWFQYFFVVGVHLLFNLFLILWLRRVFLPYHRRSLSAVAGRGLLDDFYRRHGISNREKEIAELILLGKSNRDIEHQLFISPHTVKNHIYNLYQKSGVKSRSQLIHLILRSNNRA